MFPHFLKGVKEKANKTGLHLLQNGLKKGGAAARQS